MAAAGRHWGGTGAYVEGERVFAPPQGAFDPDWVAALAADRLGRPVPHEALLGAVHDAWTGLRAGTLAPGDALPGHDPDVAAAVISAARDFVQAYAVDV